MLKFISWLKKGKIRQNHTARTRKALWVSSKLHSGKFKVLVKFSHLRSFFIKWQRNGQDFLVSKIFTNVHKFDATALKLAIKLDGFIPKNHTKRARIHFSLGESFLTRLTCLKISMLWNFPWRCLQLKIIGHCFIWQRMPRKEKLS